MRPAEKIRKLFVKSKVTVGSELDDTIMAAAFQAFEKSEKTELAKLEPNIWRIIIRSRITQFAAAVVVIAALAIGFWPEGTLTSKVYGISDVPGLLRNVQTLRVQGYSWCYGQEPEFPDLLEAKMVPVERWVDVANLRIRQISPSPYTKADGKKYIEWGESVHSGPVTMDINHTRKNVWYNKYSALDRRLRIRRYLDDFANLVKEEDLDGYVKVGKEVIDGTEYDIWECDDLVAPNQGKCKFRCWVSPTSGKIGRIYIWWRPADDDRWRPTEVLERIEQNVPIPKEVFAFDELDGYEHHNTPETAPDIELSKWTAGIGGMQVTFHTCFTLPDGSVIVGWKGFKDENENQEDLFTGLQVGEEFPNLPVILAELRLIPSANKPSWLQRRPPYTGRHLTYTTKENRFIEWGIYVMEEKIPAKLGQHCYKGCYRLRHEPDQPLLERNPVWGTTVRAEEFDEFVRAAMAELSDGGAVPDYVTYENVMQLAGEIRQSLQDQ